MTNFALAASAADTTTAAAKPADKAPGLMLVLGLVIAAAALLLAADPAMAQQADIFASINEKGCSLYAGVKRTFYIGSGLGLLALAFMAAFGRFRWTWFFSLAGAVALIALTTQVLQFLGLTVSGGCSF